MEGRIAAEDLVAGVIQSIYQNRTESGAVVTVCFVNRNATPVKVRLASHPFQNAPDAFDYIEYDVEIPGKGHLERSGVGVASLGYLSVRTDTANVNCVVWGSEVGADISGTTIVTSFDFVDDVINAPKIFKGEAYSFTPETVDQGGTPTFNLASGSLPTGLSLDSATGEISGTQAVTTPGTDNAVTFTIEMTNTVNPGLTRSREITIIESWRDGSSRERAAPNGQYLASNYAATTTTGIYWIKNSNMPEALQMYVDMTEDSGGYDFYVVQNDQVFGPNANLVTSPHVGNALGLDIVYPRSKNHWRAMANCVRATDGTNYHAYFQTCYAVTKPSSGGNYTGTIMRDAAYYGSGSSDHEVPDGGRWWLRDSTFNEPNGDYAANAFFGLKAGGYDMPGYPGTYNLSDIGFNDGTDSYYLGPYYLLSTNAKS